MLPRHTARHECLTYYVPGIIIRINAKRKCDAMAKWLDSAVFYEIFPRSLRNTNADSIGNF